MPVLVRISKVVQMRNSKHKVIQIPKTSKKIFKRKCLIPRDRRLAYTSKIKLNHSTVQNFRNFIFMIFWGRYRLYVFRVSRDYEKNLQEPLILGVRGYLAFTLIIIIIDIAYYAKKIQC